MDLKLFLRELKANGWSYLQPRSTTSPNIIFGALGPPLPSRRDTDFIDLRPRKKDSAPFASLSSLVGMAKQPMHTDAAYHPLPPHYLVFQCLEPGEATCPTHVWAVDVPRLRKDRPEILTTPNWVTRGGGLAPFYCSAMQVHSGEVRVRFDPLCMAIGGDCHAAAKAAQILRTYSKKSTVEWRRGAFLIMDNWRCLHARGPGGHNAPSRLLRRWNIGVGHGLGV